MSIENFDHNIPDTPTSPQENMEGAEKIALLKRESMMLDAVYFAGGNSYSKDITIRPYTWNENQGVIVFADGKGHKYATPSSEQTRKLLYDANMQKDQSIGVPWLNHKEYWGDEKRRNSMGSFQEWTHLIGENESEQELVDETPDVTNISPAEQIKAVENNATKLRRAREVLNIPLESLQNFSQQDRFQMIVRLRWNRWEDSESEKAPEEIFDAESRIYDTYEPSQALQKFQEHVLDDAITKIGSTDLLRMERNWESGGIEVRQQIADRWVELLCESYEINRIGTTLLEGGGFGEIFMYAKSGMRTELGGIGILRKQLGSSSFLAAMELLVHETNHAYQDAIEKELVELREGLEDDLAWFKFNDEQDIFRNGREFKSSTARYHSLPVEKDSWSLQAKARIKIKEALTGYRNEIMAANGLPEFEVLERNAKLAGWADHLLESGQAENGDGLVAIATAKLTELGREKISFLFAGKNRDDCLNQIQKIKEDRERADALFAEII